MKRIDSYLSKYKDATPLWRRVQNDLAGHLSEVTGELVIKSQLSVSGTKIHLRGISASLRSYILIHREEINRYIKTIPQGERLHL